MYSDSGVAKHWETHGFFTFSNKIYIKPLILLCFPHVTGTGPVEDARFGGFGQLKTIEKYCVFLTCLSETGVLLRAF